MLLWMAIVYGIVEGITEFLPISSTGHLILLDRFLPLPEEFGTMFNIVIQFGAILAVLLYFWNDLWPFHLAKDSSETRRVLGIWSKVAVGVLPALVLGYLLADWIEDRLFCPRVVAGALFVGGVLLIAVERFHKPVRVETVEDIGFGLAFAIGLIQCLAMIPGTSRSAATIVGAMCLGASRRAAAEYSFFLAIPTMAAASGYSLLKHGLHCSATEWVALGVGCVVAFFVAWAVVAFLMHFIRRHKFTVFGVYRIALALAVWIFFGL